MASPRHGRTMPCSALLRRCCFHWGFRSPSTSGVIAAFGQHLAKQGSAPTHLHRYLIRAMEVCQAGDYGVAGDVGPEESAAPLGRAEEFLADARRSLDRSAET